MEEELGQFLFAAVNQQDVLRLTFARSTISRARLKYLANRRARGKDHIDRASGNKEVQQAAE
jgi:hypothetical protein